MLHVIRYPTTLKDYLSVVNLTVDPVTGGFAHMGAHGIAHRDIKCDIILLDIDAGARPRNITHRWLEVPLKLKFNLRPIRSFIAFMLRF
ncbi:hypothetical protein DPMN_096951 [Dreissena polymorpha]|uniref:Protein kinase domain-containing protein n=1 Tax=Dreissena polymorpha TaxID=45954 RepID=A0A9D4LAR7_DREPO|nr:hypothetical protein DPMN_096951 [Dreissena polymorpha]